jgi:hypothetical protein
MEAEEELLSKRHCDVALKEFALDQERKGYLDQIRQLESRLDIEKEHSTFLHKDKHILLDRINTLVNELDAAQEELEKLRAFEAHIGSLLQRAQ